MRKTKLFFILISIFFVLQNIDANNAADSIQPVKVKPKFIYKIDNLTYFDNRLFYLPYHKSKMYIGDRLTALVGIGLNKEGEHKLYAGLTAIVPFGADFKEYKFLPMVYYKYQKDLSIKNYKQTIKLHFGILPYREMEMSFPVFIRKGSAEYSMPNLQGALAQYKLNFMDNFMYLFFEYAFDWRKIKTKTQRDNFGMILNGKFNFYKYSENYDKFSVGFITQWDRLGHNLDTIKNNVDNIVINPFFKVDFSEIFYDAFYYDGFKKKKIKTFYLQLGYLGSFSNDNIFVNKKWNNSLVIDFGIQWKMISLKNSLYISLNKEKDGNLMPLHQYYPELYISDYFYRAPLYNRTELCFDLLNIKSIFSLKAQFLMHVVPDYKIGWQQKITAQVKF